MGGESQERREVNETAPTRTKLRKGEARSGTADSLTWLADEISIIQEGVAYPHADTVAFAAALGVQRERHRFAASNLTTQGTTISEARAEAASPSRGLATHL